MIINGYHTGDIHFDESNAERLATELNEVFIKSIDFDTPFIITITGDLVHKKMSFDSQCAIEVIKFVSKLRKLVIQANLNGVEGYLRIVTGTLTHDNRSLKTLEAMWADEDDQHVIHGSVSGAIPLIRFIEIVTQEIIEFPSISGVLDILYVPEEYPKNVEEYYYNFFRDTYDFIFGHGTFNFTAHSSQKYESERSLASAPIFDEKEFSKKVKCYAIFGHIHTAQKSGKVQYHGSYSRECHGEEKPKGFLHTTITTDVSGNIVDSKIEFIENTLAPKFIKISLTLLLTKIKRKPEWDDNQFVSYICSVVNHQFKVFKKIRLIIDCEIDQASQAIIRGFFAGNLNFQYFEDVKIKSVNTASLVIDTIVADKPVDKIGDNGDIIPPTEQELESFNTRKIAVSEILQDPDNIVKNIGTWLKIVEKQSFNPNIITSLNK